MRRAVTLPILGLLVLVASCSLMPSGIGPTVDTPHTYASPTELAQAVRTRELGDRTMTFSAKYQLPGLSITEGPGVIAIGLSEIDSKLHLVADDAGPDFDLVSIGPDVYSKSSSTESQAWGKSSIGNYAMSGPVPVDTLLFTRLDAIESVLTLTEESHSPGTLNVTYRLHDTWQSAINSEMREIGAGEIIPDNGNPTPLDLDLTLDPQDRLINASWSTAGHGTTSTAEYTFADWGKPAAISVPAG